MGRSFPETLAALRKERNISQRKAAADLNISQALLSHYENGAREPGLNFVCRVCDYYGVSADYLLCRTELPNATHTAVETAAGFLNEMEALIAQTRRSLGTLSDQEDPA